MADELALGKIPDGIVVRRLILAELRRRGLYPLGAQKPIAQPEGEPITRTERAGRAEEKASKKTGSQASRSAMRAGTQARSGRKTTGR
jgi:hypothetical protein